MDFQKLIGQTFQENEFYELLLVEIEDNFIQYFSKFLHFYFDRTQDKKIMITDVVYFKDSMELDKKSREIIEKKEWFEIAQNHNHLNLLLCRFDRTGHASSVWEDSTRTEDCCLGWADEEPYVPMTQEEIREAFQDLYGVFTEQQNLQKLRSKKAV